MLEIVNTEDVSLFNADNLRNYDAVYFFTSGELPLHDQQKADLLDFVRRAKASADRTAPPIRSTPGPSTAN